MLDVTLSCGGYCLLVTAHVPYLFWDDEVNGEETNAAAETELVVLVDSTSSIKNRTLVLVAAVAEIVIIKKKGGKETVQFTKVIIRTNRKRCGKLHPM